MPKLLKSKAQFFIISAVIIISIFATISKYFYKFGEVDLTQTEKLVELEYIPRIKQTLYNTVNVSLQYGWNDVEIYLNETETLLIEWLREQGIDLSIKHEILQAENKVKFWFNITSANFFSETYFEYP
jgi:hypothetical protein